MEDSPLNLAHREDRRAQQHLKSGRFDEALKCHQLAAEYIESAISTTSSLRALESLTLQREFHLRQSHIVKLKRTQLCILKQALENKRRILAHMRTKMMEGDQKGQEPKSIQTAIYRTMQEADSLFIELLNCGNDTVDGVNQESTDDSSPSTISSTLGSKRPKEDRVVIEELHTLNQQLRDLINTLLIQLDESENENKTLRTRIGELESELRVCKQGHGSVKESGGLQVITDSTGGNFSPFVLSPVSQLSPDGVESQELPALAPLEMPKFDYTM